MKTLHSLETTNIAIPKEWQMAIVGFREAYTALPLRYLLLGKYVQYRNSYGRWANLDVEWGAHKDASNFVPSMLSEVINE